MKNNSDPLHIAKIYPEKQAPTLLFLLQNPDGEYEWYMSDKNSTGIKAANIEEANRLANRHWALAHITFLNCGFRYTLPERDEHGRPALFHHMKASYHSPNGIYFDEELGMNCIVHNASSEALSLI